MRPIPAALIVAVLSLTGAEAAAANTVTVPEYRKALEHAYQYRHHGGDFRVFGGAPHARARLKRWREQARGPVSRGYMRRLTRERVAEWRWHREIDTVTPWGPWAVPYEIIACESGGSWSADNPTSDARGPYQLLGHGEPWPADTPEAQAAHHIIAASLYAGGSGASHWAQCL